MCSVKVIWVGCAICKPPILEYRLTPTRRQASRPSRRPHIANARGKWGGVFRHTFSVVPCPSGPYPLHRAEHCTELLHLGKQIHPAYSITGGPKAAKGERRAGLPETYCMPTEIAKADSRAVYVNHDVWGREAASNTMSETMPLRGFLGEEGGPPLPPDTPVWRTPHKIQSRREVGKLHEMWGRTFQEKNALNLRTA